ncbi:unnamed protein product, partial [Meganyctiphanes norvegica]
MEEKYYIPDEVYTVLMTRFHIVFPIFIVLTIIINIACILVTRRPKLRAYHSNGYIQMMAVLDVLSSLTQLPFVFDTDFCLYNSYSYAFFFTHFGWKMVDGVRT